MRNRVFGRQLSRDHGSRIALKRSLIEALVVHGKITTTKAKAKAIQPDVEKILTISREDSVSARRRILSKLGNNKKVVKLLYDKKAFDTKKVTSGFTKITTLPRRKGDNAELATIEWAHDFTVASPTAKRAKKGTTAKDATKTESRASKLMKKIKK